jgi:prophage antirepressor-like protein
MNALNPMIFDFAEKFPLRLVTKEGEPWFVAADVCAVIEIVNVSQAVERLDVDERGICKTYTTEGLRELLIISESGVYHLLLTSNKPEAQPFRKWVTSEVLPSIRKQGFYSTNKAALPLARQMAVIIRQIQQTPDSASREVLRQMLKNFGAVTGIAIPDDLGEQRPSSADLFGDR